MNQKGQNSDPLQTRLDRKRTRYRPGSVKNSPVRNPGSQSFLISRKTQSHCDCYQFW